MKFYKTIIMDKSNKKSQAKKFKFKSLQLKNENELLKKCIKETSKTHVRVDILLAQYEQAIDTLIDNLQSRKCAVNMLLDNDPDEVTLMCL